jgi:hypothetical protein
VTCRLRLSLASRTAVFLLLDMVCACSSQRASPAPAPEAVLEGIRTADPTQYDHIRDMKQWRNPYLIIRTDGVALYDSADSAEIIVKPDELLAALARLPATNWPYGRVVAATEVGVRSSEQDGVAIRRNRGIVGGMLQGAHVAIKWVPTA